LTYVKDVKDWTALSIACTKETVVSHSQRKGYAMEKYVCTICDWVFDPVQGDPENGIAPGVEFEDLPDDWLCPVCGAPKSEFEKKAA
jgi:rubredoxin